MAGAPTGGTGHPGLELAVLDAAWRQLRHGLSVATGRRIRVADVRELARHLRLTLDEFGRLEREQMLEALGAAVDPEFRRSMDATRWRKVVRKAYKETVYYRQLLDRLGLDPEMLTLDRIAELPPTPKATLRALPEVFVSSTASPVMQACTTGTTGTPTSCWFSVYELELAAAYGAVSLMVSVGMGPQDVVQVCTSSRAALGGHNLMQSTRMFGAAYVVTGVIDPAEALSRMATPVHLPGKKPKISVLSIFPSYLGSLLQAAEALGYAGCDFGIEKILTGGEVLSASLRRRVEEFFGATVYDSYGMTESFPLAGLVCSQGHLHFAADQGLVEVLDPVTFVPTQPGQVGMLVVTPFLPYRETTLVLRLATGDLVRRLPEQPTCELAGQPATSVLLGKAELSTTAGDQPLYQRDVLELLEAEGELPLPIRYGIERADDGVNLHVYGPEDPVLVARLEQSASDAGLPVRKIVLHGPDTDLPEVNFSRSMLHETVVVRDEEAGTWALR